MYVFFRSFLQFIKTAKNVMIFKEKKVFFKKFLTDNLKSIYFVRKVIYFLPKIIFYNLLQIVNLF